MHNLDPITKDLIQKARFDEGEFVIKSEDIESLKMLKKQPKMKTKNSINDEDDESDEESANNDLENSSNTNCTTNEPMETKQTFLGENHVTDTAENENVEVNIAHVVDCNGSEDVSSKLIATKPTLSGEKTVIEKSEKANHDIEQLDDFSNGNNCILKEPFEMEQHSTVGNNTMEIRMENLQSEHSLEYDFIVDDCVLYEEKMVEKNLDNFFVRNACGNNNSLIKSFTETTLQENNENFNSDEVVGKSSKAAKPDVENTDVECGDSNSEALVSETKAEADSELLNELKISNDVENKDESNLPVNLPESGAQTFVNKDEICIQNEGDSNIVQNVELCDIAEKKKIHAIAKMFTDQYEFVSKEEMFIPGGEIYESFQKGLSRAHITLSTISDLNYDKSEYFYKVFKKFQEDKLQTVENKAEPNDASTTLQNVTCQQVASLKENEQEGHVQNSAAMDLLLDSVIAQKVVNSDTCLQSCVTNGVPDSSREQNVITEENAESIQKYFCNPKCESTPQYRIESEEGQNQLQTSSDSDKKLPKLSKLMTAFQQLSDESDSDDLGGSEYSSDHETSKELNSDSCSDFSSEGSSSDSCSDSSSSEDLTSESHCHRKNHSTRKHYSSSVSDSSGSSRDSENIYHSRYNKKPCNMKRDHRYCQQNYKCFCGKRNQSHCVGCAACNPIQQSSCFSRGNATCRRSCFLPSTHRYHCHDAAACSQWHKTFLNQWQQIQRGINLQLHF